MRVEGNVFQPGRRVGSFLLQRQLGLAEGTELWLASRVDPTPRDATEVVVRLVKDPEDREASDAVRREYDDLRVLGDSRIPRVVGYYGGMGALVLEHVHGVTLRQLINAAREGHVVIDGSTALDIVLEVAHGIRHVHSIVREEGRIVHGHLSPDRVRLTTDGDVKITGIGCVPEQLDARYLPPEVAARASCDERTDQWQVGAILYELLALRPLYTGGWSEAFRLALRGDVSELVDDVVAKWPHLDRILRRALAPLPADRFQVESEFLRALHTASREIGRRSSRRELASKLLSNGHDTAEAPPTPTPKRGSLMERATGQATRPALKPMTFPEPEAPAAPAAADPVVEPSPEEPVSPPDSGSWATSVEVELEEPAPVAHAESPREPALVGAGAPARTRRPRVPEPAHGAQAVWAEAAKLLTEEDLRFFALGREESAPDADEAVEQGLVEDDQPELAREPERPESPPVLAEAPELAESPALAESPELAESPAVAEAPELPVAPPLLAEGHEEDEVVIEPHVPEPGHHLPQELDLDDGVATVVERGGLEDEEDDDEASMALIGSAVGVESRDQAGGSEGLPASLLGSFDEVPQVERGPDDHNDEDTMPTTTSTMPGGAFPHDPDDYSGMAVTDPAGFRLLDLEDPQDIERASPIADELLERRSLSEWFAVAAVGVGGLAVIWWALRGL